MLKDKEAREKFHIASSLEEAKDFAEKIGYLVLLVPFGVPDISEVIYQASRTANGPEELVRCFEEMQGRSDNKPLFGFVHIIKSQRNWKC